MRFFLSIAVLCLLALTAPVNAAPVCAASGTFADLMATGSCAIGDKVFSNFTYQPSQTGGATPVEASSFTYITVDNAPDAIGFQFAFALTALPGQSNDILVGWLVTGPNITSDHLIMAGTALGNALASIAETYCLGGPITGCPAENVGALSTLATDTFSKMADSATFGPVGQVGVFKNINVTAGAGGFATLSGMSQTVDQVVPEPSTLLLGGISLVSAALLRRFRSVRH